MDGGVGFDVAAGPPPEGRTTINIPAPAPDATEPDAVAVTAPVADVVSVFV